MLRYTICWVLCCMICQTLLISYDCRASLYLLLYCLSYRLPRILFHRNTYCGNWTSFLWSRTTCCRYSHQHSERLSWDDRNTSAWQLNVFLLKYVPVPAQTAMGYDEMVIHVIDSFLIQLQYRYKASNLSQKYRYCNKPLISRPWRR